MRILDLNKETTSNILESLKEKSQQLWRIRITRGCHHRGSAKESRCGGFSYTKQFDRAEISADNIVVTDEEINEAYATVAPELLDVIRKSLVNIRAFHSKQLQNSWFTSGENGTILGQKVTPLDKVGVYVPGGKAVYPSSVLMNVVPAKVAGVPHIYMTTPPGADGKIAASTLVAAKEAGVDTIYKVGGAQAIAALAFGTESIPKVDKIVGGNIYVALAKGSVRSCQHRLYRR